MKNNPKIDSGGSKDKKPKLHCMVIDIFCCSEIKNDFQIFC